MIIDEPKKNYGQRLTKSLGNNHFEFWFLELSRREVSEMHVFSRGMVKVRPSSPGFLSGLNTATLPGMGFRTPTKYYAFLCISILLPICWRTNFVSWGVTWTRAITFWASPVCTSYCWHWAVICDNVFIIVPLSEGLPLTTEIKQVLKQDLDLDLDVPKFNCYFPVIESTTTSIHVLFSKCSVHQSSVRMSVRYGRRHLHDGVTCHRGAHWQWWMGAAVCAGEGSCSPDSGENNRTIGRPKIN